MAEVKFTRKSFRTFAGRECIVTYGTARGSQPGPVLTVIAGQHGMEHSGPNLLPWFVEEIIHDRPVWIIPYGRIRPGQGRRFRPHPVLLRAL